MRLGRVLCLVTGVVTLGACQVHGLQFREDQGFRVVQPADRSTVSLPIVVRWTRPEDAPTGLHRFAVFVDRPPPRPGQSLADLARSDRVCVRGHPCPSPSYLASEQIHLAAQQRVVIPSVAKRPEAPFGLEDVHEATVVLLDARGRRIGEAAASVQFRLERDRTPPPALPEERR